MRIAVRVTVSGSGEERALGYGGWQVIARSRVEERLEEGQGQGQG